MLEIIPESATVTVLIRDNGPGFESQAVSADHGSIAMQLVRERLKLRGSEGDFTVYRETIDGQDVTTVRLSIPIEGGTGQNL